MNTVSEKWYGQSHTGRVIRATLVCGNDCILYFTRFYHFLLFFSNLLPSFSFHPLLSSYDYFLCQYSFFTTPFLTFPPFHLRAQLLNKYS